MKLPKNFSPTKVVQAVNGGNCSWIRLADGGWTGVVLRKNGSELRIEELETSWKVTDVVAESTLEGQDLKQLLRRAL